MRFGFSRANETIRQIVSQKTALYDLTRKVDEANGRFGEHDASEATVTDVPLYLFNEGESAIDTDFGDRLSGDLEGLALPDADVRKGDELTHDGTVYEVDEKPEMVKDGLIKAITLVKKVND